MIQRAPIRLDDLPLHGALIGAGAVTSFHLHAWQRIPQAEIVAIVDPKLTTAQARAREFNINIGRVYASLDELFRAESNLDFVDIAAPPEAHLVLVKRAADRGVHILCQKPFAHTLADAQAMIDLCKAAGVLLCVNENWRWRWWFRMIKEILSDGQGEIGRPIYTRFFAHGDGVLTGRLSWKLSADHRFRSWKRVILFDWGTHLIDVLRFLHGEPESVYARIHHTISDLAGEDRAHVMLAYDDLTAIIDISWSSYDPYGYPRRENHVVEDFRLEGTHGTIRLIPDPGKGDLLRITSRRVMHEGRAYDGNPHDAYLNSYFAAQWDFIKAVLSGLLPETHAEDNYNTLAITLAAYQSAETNQVVRIADFKRAQDHTS
jgi:predicted dehydrogenase